MIACVSDVQMKFPNENMQSSPIDNVVLSSQTHISTLPVHVTLDPMLILHPMTGLSAYPT